MTKWQSEFEALGVNVAAMSYDDVSVLEDFAAAQGIGYALLSDKGGMHAKQLGILNEEYSEEHLAYGVPHPGVLFIDPSGRVLLKRAVPGYRERPPLDELLSALESLLEAEMSEELLLEAEMSEEAPGFPDDLPDDLPEELMDAEFE